MDERLPQPPDTELPAAGRAPEGVSPWVEVAYAEPDEQFLLTVSLTPGLTVLDAIEQSGILTHRPNLEISDSTVGLFSQKTKLGTALTHRDRVEIYRPLINDPKDIRRRKAADKLLKKQIQ